MEEQQVSVVTEENLTSQQQEGIQNVPIVDKRKKKWLVIGIIATAVLILSVVLCLVLNALSPQTVAEKYVEAYLFGDACELQKYSAYDYYGSVLGDYCDEEEYFEIMSERYDEDITSWEDLSEVSRAYVEEEASDNFGEYEFSIETTRVKDISLRKLNDECGYTLRLLENKGLIDQDDISEAKEVTVKLKIKGEDGTERQTRTVYLVKCGLLWKSLYMS